ncbi:MAG TPA: RagB/SusD family nutrient uptake outer membrane protein [Longimicrobium sp.]|nr:RagB/SusD family nutrient uptake outer membrane protein [Longimicrobium sp.]
MFKKACRAMTVAAAAALWVGASGCTDVTLEPESTVTEQNVFRDPSSYRAFIAKIYAGLSVTGQEGPAGQGDIQGIDEGFSQYVRLLWQMQELPTDEAVIAWGDDGVQQLNTQLWSTSNQFLGSMYYRIFFQVALVNEFLRQTTDEKLAARNVSTELRAEIAQYRAEARFLRALSYWHAIDLFGNTPLVKEDFPLGTTPPQQSTRAEIFEYVVSELQAIRPLLPAAHTGEYGRADQGAVQMLLAKVLMNAPVYVGQNRNADARAALETILNAYTLDDRYRDLFLADNHTSPELIFAVPQDGTKQQSYGGTTFLIHASVGGDMSPAQWGINGGWWGLRVKPEILSIYPGGINSSDVRSTVFFTQGQTVQINDITAFQQGLGAPKYRNVTSTGQAGSHVEFTDTDYPMFRLGDAYLMYAELVLRGGGGSTAQALTYVNALRQRAYGNTSGNITAAQLTLDFILDERARELLWEGHRRTDLIRYNRFTTAGIWAFKGGVKAGQTTAAFRNLYPLPATELITNPNLDQNPGYTN